MTYAIWCEVRGGVTGHRQSFMKEKGEVKLFDTFEECAAKCKEFNTLCNGPYAKAFFKYSPVVYGKGEI